MKESYKYDFEDMKLVEGSFAKCHCEELKKERDALKRKVADLSDGIKGYEKNNDKYHQLLKLLKPFKDSQNMEVQKLKKIITDWDLNDIENENKRLRKALEDENNKISVRNKELEDENKNLEYLVKDAIDALYNIRQVPLLERFTEFKKKQVQHLKQGEVNNEKEN